MEIGIIGFGRFGRFAAGILKNDFDVFVHDVRPIQPGRGIKAVSLKEIATKPVLFLCVPISELEEICGLLKPLLSPGQLVLDACSVKEKPLQIMLKGLPRFVEVIGTHPLFGPDSGKAGIRGLTIALCPARGSRIQKVQKYLKNLGLKVIVTTARKHDSEMARTQALFHFLARGVAGLQIEVGALATPGPARLFREFQDVQNDSQRLFYDLQRLNRFAAPMRRRLLRNLQQIDRKLTSRTSSRRSGESPVGWGRR
ncbi:MAG: prephenate dehydrogenase [Acidobacteriota bacterium]